MVKIQNIHRMKEYFKCQIQNKSYEVNTILKVITRCLSEECNFGWDSNPRPLQLQSSVLPTNRGCPVARGSSYPMFWQRVPQRQMCVSTVYSVLSRVLFYHRTQESTEYTVLTHIRVWVKTKIKILYRQCKFNKTFNNKKEHFKCQIQLYGNKTILVKLSKLFF